MLQIIPIVVNGQALVCDSIKAASDLIAEVRCDFSLSAEWADFQTVSAIFEDKYGTKIEAVLTNGYCMVPHEVLHNRGAVKVNLAAYKLTGTTKTLQMTSYRTVIIEVLQSVNTSGDNSAAPTAPTWQQQLALRLTDAPSDGSKYARQDGEWVAVTEGGGGGGGGTSDYTQLTNKPQINGVTITGNKSLATIGAAASNHTHDYDDITNKPTIPEAYDDTALSGRVSTIEGKEAGWDSKAAGNHTHAYSAITGKPSTFTPSAHSHVVADISDFPSIPTDNIELANGAGYITDAPSDSKQYARKNGAWAEVVAGGGGSDWNTLASFTLEENTSLISVDIAGKTIEELVVVLFGRWGEGMTGYLDFAFRTAASESNNQYRFYETNQFYNNNDRACACYAIIMRDCKIFRVSSQNFAKYVGRVLDNTAYCGFGYPSQGVTSMSIYNNLVIYPLVNTNEFKAGCTVEVYYK